MIKINLLPKSINEKRILKQTAIIFAVVFIAIIAAGVTYGFKLKGDVADMTAKAEETEAYEARVKKIKSDAQSTLASAKPMQQKLDFINAVLEYNTQYPKLYEEIAKWTYDKVQYMSMQSDGTQVMMQARAQSLDDVGRYLLNMYRATDLFTSVTISGVPGYPTGRQSDYAPGGIDYYAGDGGGSDLAGIGAISQSMVRRPEAAGGNWIGFDVVAKLKNPIAAPTFAGAAQTQATGGGGAPMPGMPMPKGGMPMPPSTPAPAPAP